MNHIWVLFLAHVVLSTVATEVHESGELLNTAEVCQYMQCVEDGSKLSLKFNETMWKQFSEQLNTTFDLNTWNWSKLDDLVQENRTFEVVFNGLETLHVHILQGHGSVTTLNLDNNQIAMVENEAFANFKALMTLSLRGNMITVVNDFVYNPNMLQHLDLASNRINDIKGLKTYTLSHLTYLNLSHNLIKSIGTELSKLEALETLDLSRNAIKRREKPIILPKNLQQLLLHNNELTTWPFETVPETLTDLSLGFNQINLTKEATNVRRLDLSYNRLASFCGECFPSLEELDLSGNYLEALPRFGNQPTRLRKISFNRMPNLQSIERSTFQGVTEQLHELEISFCPQLTTIEFHAFADLKELKRLDLSYNALQQVPENMVNWNQIEQGVNLQGNPINCACSMQWLVDRVIPAMHSKRELHKLFPNLRCAQPAIYKDHLIVHLTVHDNLMCRKYQEMDLPGMETVVQLMKEHRQMQFVRAQQIILAALICGIILEGVSAELGVACALPAGPPVPIGLARSLSGSKSSSSKLELVVSSVIRSRDSSFTGGVVLPVVAPDVDAGKSGVSPL
uniref:LRRCT domain-containing protein n=1 Tax=Anopheles culicifacies TaxID=139723 RepID=A0A182MPE7_9DIPT